MTLFSGWMLLTPYAARADSQVDCHLISDCDNLLDKAQRMAGDGHWQMALSLFESLYARYPDPRMSYNIARALHQLGRPAEAVPKYQHFLSSGVETDSTQLAKARRYLDQAQQEASPPPSMQRLTPDYKTSTEQLAVALQPSLATEKDLQKPVYKQWWLWLALGSVACATAIGVSVGLTIQTPTVPPYREAMRIQ